MCDRGVVRSLRALLNRRVPRLLQSSTTCDSNRDKPILSDLIFQLSSRLPDPGRTVVTDQLVLTLGCCVLACSVEIPVCKVRAKPSLQSTACSVRELRVYGSEAYCTCSICFFVSSEATIQRPSAMFRQNNPRGSK